MIKVMSYGEKHSCGADKLIHIIRDPKVSLSGVEHPIYKFGWWLDVSQAVFTDDVIAMYAISYCPYCGKALYVKA